MESTQNPYHLPFMPLAYSLAHHPLHILMHYAYTWIWIKNPTENPIGQTSKSTHCKIKWVNSIVTVLTYNKEI